MQRTSITLLLVITLCAVAIASPEVKVGRLDNGLDVVLVENHSVPMIAANLVVKIGARDETWQTWGSAHFLEHMLFNGTKTRTQEEIYAGFDNIGVYNNAHTGSHFTDFMVLAGETEFTTGFDILAEMVFESTLPIEKIDKEKGIVEEEIARSRTSEEDIGLGFDQLLFGHSPLSREVLGTPESIAALDRDSVWAFYRTWYVPNNTLLFATGDFASDTLFDWFNKRLTKYPPRELPPRKQIDAPDFASLSTMGTVAHQVSGDRRIVAVACDAPKPGSADFIAMTVALRALDRRFETDLPKGVTGSTEYVLDPDVALVKLSLSSPKDGPLKDELQKILANLLGKFADKPPKDQEIAKIAQSYRAEQTYNTERLHYYGMMYATMWALLPWDDFTSWQKRIAATTPEQLSNVTKRWLITDKSLAMVGEPAGAVTAAGSTVSLGQLKQSSSNGPTLIVRSDPSAKVFAIHILAKDRWLWDDCPPYHPGAVDLLHRVLAQAASPGKKLGDRLETIAGTLKCADELSIPYDDYYTSADYSFFRLEVLPEKWAEGIDLIADLLEVEPLTGDLLTSARDAAAASKSMSGKNPVGAGIGKIREKLLSGTNLAASVYGDTKEVTLEELQSLRSAYLNPGNLIITIAGPVDTGEVAQAITRALADRVKQAFAYPKDWTRDTRSVRDVGSQRDTLSLGRPQGAVVMGALLADIPDTVRAALIIANSYFSDQMADVLREKKGLAYSLGSSLNLLRSDGGKLWGSWEISIGTRPEKLAEAEGGIQELLTALGTHKFTQAEINRITSVISGRMMMRDMARIGQAYAMGIGEFYWGDPDARTHLIERLKAITPEQVEAARHYLDSSKLLTIIVK